MARDLNTLYPPNYVEPQPVEPPPDDDDNGRNVDRALQVLRGSVPVGAEPLKKYQLSWIVRGREARYGADSLNVAVPGDAAAIRIAALAATPEERNKGIIPDVRIGGFTTDEWLQMFDMIVAEREDSWTFNDPDPQE